MIGTETRWVAADGRDLSFPLERFLSHPTPAERRILDLAEGPLLDVGCGPGRHVLELSHRGVTAMGVDAAPAPVRLARARGASVLQRSIFDRLPGEGRWVSALLLDGNIGIGGDPLRLLGRLRDLLRSGGRLWIELESPASSTESLAVRIEASSEVTPWFSWARVSATDIAVLGERSGFTLDDLWTEEDRWFAAVSSAS